MDPFCDNLTSMDPCKYSLDVSFQLPGLVCFPPTTEYPNIGTVHTFNSFSQMKSTFSPSPAWTQRVFSHLPCDPLGFSKTFICIHSHTFDYENSYDTHMILPFFIIMNICDDPYSGIPYQRPGGFVDLNSCIWILRLWAKAAWQCSS